MHDDALDQLTDRIHGLPLAGQSVIRDHVRQPVDLREVSADRRRVQRHHLRRLLGEVELPLQLVALPAQLGDDCAGFILSKLAVDQRLDAAIERALSRGQLGFDLRPARIDPPAQRPHLPIVRLDVERDRTAIGELFAKASDHGLLNSIEVIDPPVGAGAGFAHLRTDEPQPAVIPVLDRHSAAAVAAFQQARQQPLALRSAGGPHVAGELERLHLVEQLGVDDLQVRRVGSLPFALRVRPADPLPGVGIAHHLDPVPNQPPRINLVLQDAAAPLVVAVDRRRRPELAARRRHAVAIEICSDVPARRPRGVGIEDAPNDRGLGLDDLQLAGASEHRPVTVRAPAGIPAVPNDAGHAAANLVREVLEIQRADEAADTDLDVIGAPVVNSDDLDALECEPLEDAGEVFLIAAEPVKGLDNDDIECAAFGGVE